jgi:TolB-like protein
MSAEVFISYASEDRERILDLVERLRGAGVSVWIDQMGIEGATMWSQEIVEAIDGCKVLILAISQRSTESENVVKELALASERRKKILPVCLDSSGIPKSMEYQLAGIQRVEYVKGEEDQGILAMIRSLGKLGVIVSDEASEQAAKAPGIISPGPSHQRGFNTIKREIVPWLKITTGLTGLVLLVIGIFFLGSSGKKTPEQNLPLAKPQTLDTNRVVVLPFKTIGTSGETADLGYGLVSTLTSKLQPLQNLTIIANESALQFEDSKLPPKKIGESLQVGTIVTGEIQTSDEKIQVNIRVIDANTEALVWGSTFSKTKNEFLDLQNVIATQLATKLKGSLNEDETKQLALKATENVEAQAAYQSGRREWNKRSKEGFLNAIKNFEKAINLDLNYAQPYVGLADTYMMLAFYNFGKSEVQMPKAKLLAQKAIEINPNISGAYATLGMIFLNHEFNWQLAKNNFEKSIKLNPNYPTGLHWYGVYYFMAGEAEKAIPLLLKGSELDPESMIIKNALSMAYWLSGQNELAFETIDFVLKRSPYFVPGIRSKYGYFQADISEEAIEYLNASIKKHPDQPLVKWALFQILWANGNEDKAKDQLIDLYVMHDESLNKCFFSLMYFRMNKPEYAYKLLEESIALKETNNILMGVLPTLKQYQSDNRFVELMKSIKHPLYVDQ